MFIRLKFILADVLIFRGYCKKNSKYYSNLVLIIFWQQTYYIKYNPYRGKGQGGRLYIVGSEGQRKIIRFKIYNIICLIITIVMI